MIKERILDINEKNEEMRKAEIKKELRVILEKMNKKVNVSQAFQSSKRTAEALNALDEYDELCDQYDEKLKELGDPMGFEGMAIPNTNHGLSSGNGFNESLESHIYVVNTKTYAGKFEDRNYYITLEKQKSATEDIVVTDLTDYIESHEYDLSAKAGALQSIQGVNTDLRDDNMETFDRLSREIEDERYTNSINKMILSELSRNKTLVTLDPKTLNTSVHTYLCAKAKKNTIIVTNNTGMKKLDITDENGVALVKRVNGKVIYKDSFEVVEIDNDFMPDMTFNVYTLTGDTEINTENPKEFYKLVNGKYELVQEENPIDFSVLYEKTVVLHEPIFMGDIYGACALLKFREKRELQADGIEGFEVYSYRYIDYVKAIQRTTSDKAYIAGYIA